MEQMLTVKADKRRTLFTIGGVPWTANAQSWQFVLPKLAIGVVIALVAQPMDTTTMNILVGLGYGALLLLANILHIFGHMASSRMVAPAMTEARITPILIETRFDDDPPTVSPYTHITRSLGGPAMNMLGGTVALLAWLSLGGHGLLFFALANKIMGVFALLPVAGMDGVVIWRELSILARD